MEDRAILSVDSNLAAAHLYDSSPKLRPEYIAEVLKITDARAEAVAKINGGIHREEAALLARVVGEVDPILSLEVGLGYGFSAFTICASGKRPMEERRHIIIDPHQSTYWKNGGIQHLHEGGFAGMIELREELSYRALPQLEREQLTVDLAFIDGWHTFDFVFVDFFYIDKMLREGGVVIFDDADWASIRPILRYIVTNLPYRVIATLPERKACDPRDAELGLSGSCIALQKVKPTQERDIFFHHSF